MKSVRLFLRIFLLLCSLFGLVGFVIYALSIKAFFLTFVGLMMLAGLFIFIYEEVS